MEFREICWMGKLNRSKDMWRSWLHGTTFCCLTIIFCEILWELLFESYLGKKMNMTVQIIRQ
jgi:hypothetical protein